MEMDLSDEDDDLEVENFCVDSDSEEVFEVSHNENATPFVLPEYELLSHSGLIDNMRNDICLITNIIIVTEPIARCLLNHYKWNKEQLLDDYYNSGDLNVFFQSVGIDNPAMIICGERNSDLITDCGICYTSLSEARVSSFRCGHRFCSNCCCQYFQAKILNDGEGKIKCPEPDCKMLIDDATIMGLVPRDVQHRFESLITQIYVASNPLIRWCRSTDCEYAVKVRKPETFLVICKCGFESCFSCGELWHVPITCALLKKWTQSCVEDIESYKWIQDNAKKCPKCGINIEKNGGCNHMRCRYCHHDFCWVCMKDWRQHGSCNRFEQNEENITQRFMHYSIRYNNHIQSLKLENGLYNSVESKMKELQGMGSLTRNEVIFLKRAVDSLRQSRQLLITTYVFAYYSEKSNQLLMFEDNQRDLELATENLSWVLEQDITNESMVQIKQKLQERYSYCDKRRSVLLDHIHEGYENGYFKLN